MKSLGSLGLAGVLLLGSYAIVLRHRHEYVPAEAMARKRFYADLVKSEPTAANFKLLAEADVQTADFEGAKQAFGKAAEIYRSKNLPSEGYATERLSQRYEVVAKPFIHLPKPRKTLGVPSVPLALHEPVYGCYTGAFIDHEDTIRGTYRDEYGAWRRDASAFNHLTNTHHAIFFMYLGYGRSFPAKFVRHMNDNGAAAQIALEPDKLSAVKDDAYLHAFAKAARESRTPIFLRFASEMNGDWVPYNGNPALYIEKFRLVARVMHAEAPNVAMVWCPFETPVRTIADYYPGASAVDWVGLNVYSVPFWDNNPRRPADWRDPSDSLRYVYDRYAKRHPIMICEYAASHRSSLDNIGRSELARTKMAELYAALPRKYPRVKAVCWLSMNAIKHAIPGRQSNDYSLLGDPGVLHRYAELLRDPYFLRAVPRQGHASAPQRTIPLEDGRTLTGRISLSAWVKLYDDYPRVIWRVNGDERQASALPGPHRWVLDTSSIPEGPATIELLVLDSVGREVAHATRYVTVTH
ncbi:hypothetical protein OP10G_0985 [Fimbriimonas ginsengisoli Gsoil 348]|uniref:GH26 domain-containing protein n=1 Tax=Fimbriimonas ginsengisoli Gsoil 348 TaxID=661478 RepID=A0A068NLA2_FIMGI|nr:hypothetical protein OP10G_0985 [Fimbriimonas ginsengisoli Gsoil 348]